MGCGNEVIAMSHGIILLGYVDRVLNPGPLKKRYPSPLGCKPLGRLSIHGKILKKCIGSGTEQCLSRS